MCGKMKKAYPERFRDLAFWIGGLCSQRQVNGQHMDGEMSKWEPNLTAVKETLEIVKATRRSYNNDSFKD